MAVSYVGASAFASGTGAITVTYHASSASGDLLLLAVESANQAVTTPSGWTLVGQLGTGTAAAAGGVRLTIFSKVKASETSVTVADSGNHTTGYVLTYRDAASTVTLENMAVETTATKSFATCPRFTSGPYRPDRVPVILVARDVDTTATSAGTNFSTPYWTTGGATTNAGAGGGLTYLTYNVGYGTDSEVNYPQDSGGWSTSDKHVYATLVVEPPAPAPITQRAKIWTGTAWVTKPLKRWNGSAWVEKPIKRYNGTWG